MQCRMNSTLGRRVAGLSRRSHGHGPRRCRTLSAAWIVAISVVVKSSSGLVVYNQSSPTSKCRAAVLAFFKEKIP